ncbi:diaminopimelate decarboxylase [Actinomadura rayongensis]|uniref:Diaminopimelate decarboxylase n=1 Tax=Actinomadura rayongensis TaxID=1429076 RepID=A0A6I4W7L9_9ACTN|nr:diaminopimelate decarboxylase [Actinomadura rayongensis]
MSAGTVRDADLAVWPRTARVTGGGEIVVGGVGLSALAARFGTPLHVLDETDVRERCRAFRAAFSEVVYAGKAFLSRGMARWVRDEGLGLDVCSAGELAVARAASFPAERVVLHGNGKTPDDLRAAFAYGVGRIVVDGAGEISRLSVLATGAPQKVLLRVIPGIDPGTHPAISTGAEDQQFGVSIASGAAAEAVRRILGQRRLQLAGLHCHLGSQIADPARYERAVAVLVGFLARIRDEHGVVPPELDVGGGFAVAARPGDPVCAPSDVAGRITGALAAACAAHRLPVPRLAVEPGRAIVARAGVTVYRVLGVKRSAGGRVFATVDGGMSDNPRTALYGARYTALLTGRPSTAERPVTVVGRHCEAGDVVARDVPLPADLRPGDLLAVPCTGAYHHAMASNYNMTRRPPVVAVRDGAARVLIRRETEDDLLRRDVG